MSFLNIFQSNSFKGNLFNNCTAETNGEKYFFQTIAPHVNVIFDVGCRSETLYKDYPKEVHYFDPVPEYIDSLKKQKIVNTRSVFNKFGLSDSTTTLTYYPKYEAFYNRVASCHVDDAKNSKTLNVRRASEYISEHNIEKIDFLKIDTEGHELSVLKGFGEHIKNVAIIQFEYGGTFIDTGITLLEIVDYLKSHGFKHFAYLSPTQAVFLEDYKDHYQYCNIVCVNSKFY